MNGRTWDKVQIIVKRCRFCISGMVLAICLTGCRDTRGEKKTGQSEGIESREIMYDLVGKEEAGTVINEEESAANDDDDWEKRKNEILKELAKKEYPDVPEPFQKILRQYEQALRVTEGMDWDSALEEVADGGIAGGDWEYVEYYLYGDGRCCNICYSIADISGDGVPEMIMGIKSKYSEEWYAYVFYYYDGEDARMGYETGGRYGMTFYPNGLIEIVDSHFISYYQFQQDEQEWKCIALIQFEYDEEGQEKILLDNTDAENFLNYTDAENPASSLLEEISEEKYQSIMEQYRTTPIELEWTALWEGEPQKN